MSRVILILAANPKTTERLRIDEEVKRIEQALERSRQREQFKVVQKWATTDDDLRRGLLDHQPEVVHFCGHGSGASGLILETDAGHGQTVAGESLSRLFKLCTDHVRCVVLNACYSEVQTESISEHINYVVGMSRSIGDDAAIRYSVGFYDALGSGRNFDACHEFGCNSIDLRGLPEHLTPIIKKS